MQTSRYKNCPENIFSIFRAFIYEMCRIILNSIKNVNNVEMLIIENFKINFTFNFNCI